MVLLSNCYFGIIYGTLITVLDAFPRCFVRGVRVLKYQKVVNNDVQNKFLNDTYQICLIVGIGGFSLFYFSAASLIKLLDVVTIISFILAPIIGFLNLRAIQSEALLHIVRRD